MAVIKKKVTGISDFGRLCDAKDNLVVLDRLQDPGNIGTVIRTAEGAGYRGVICIRGTADVYSPKVVRAAAGALFRVPILYISSTDELFELVKKLNKNTFSIVLTQGLNRQIRRMCAACDRKVQKLNRVRIVNIKLDGLAVGDYRNLSEEETKRLYKELGIRDNG